jgi:hypothetical protein
MLACLLLVGCAAIRTHGQQSEPSQFRNFTFHPPTATPTPPSWQSYRAEDYRTFDKKTLTRSEVSLIRRTLSLVKPCQRPLLRFAFPANGGTNFPFVLFFQSPDDGWPHVLWTNNMYYKPVEGEIFPTPGYEPNWHGIRYDVEHQSCS